MPMMAALIDADLVIVTTQELRRSYHPITRMVVLPNYLDDRIRAFRLLAGFGEFTYQDRLY